MISREHLNYLRCKFKEHTVDTPSPMVSDIAMVGALRGEDLMTGHLLPELSYFDQRMLLTTLKAFSLSQISVCRDFNIIPVNIAQKYGGQDALDPNTTITADAFVSCFIDQTPDQVVAEEKNNSNGPGVVNPGLAYSTNEIDNFHVWGEAADRIGAKVVVTFGQKYDDRESGGEVTTQNFENFYRKIPSIMDKFNTKSDYDIFALLAFRPLEMAVHKDNAFTFDSLCA